MNKDESSCLLKEIKLELTYRCNLQCIHCSSEANLHHAPVMSFEKAEDVMKQAIDMGIKEVSFSGGEPLLWPGLTDIISLCSSATIKTQVYSAGNINNPNAMMKLLKESGISKIIFSAYASNENCHDKITQVEGSFQKTMATIDEAVKVNLSTEFHFVPLRTNYSELTRVITLAERKGVNKVSILRFVPQGRGQNSSELALTHSQNLELKQAIEENKSVVTTRLGSPYNFLMVNNVPKCCAGIDRLTISPDLYIYPCDAFKQIKPIKIVGTNEFSRLDKWSLKECWVNSPYLKAIRQHLSSPFETPCIDCKYLKRCLSGCLAQKYLKNDNLEKRRDPDCLIAG
ncbi:radical SAM protein [Planctomycetota bacterium]